MIRYEYGRSIGAPAKSEVELQCKSQISSRKVCFHGLQSAWGIMKPRKAQLGALSLKESSLGTVRFFLGGGGGLGNFGIFSQKSVGPPLRFNKKLLTPYL